MVVVMMMVVAMLLFLIIVVIVVMMVMMLVVVVVVIIVVMVFMFLVVIVVNNGAFHFLDPSSRSGNLVEVEHFSIEDFVEIDITIVASDDFGGGLQGADDALHAA
jgi:energy-coupling factor transporter transmembrane protein EcfT